MTHSIFKNKKRFSKIVASTFLFATTTWVQAYQLQGFFSSGMGVTFDTPKQIRSTNIIEDSTGQNATLNTVSQYHKEIAPSLRRQFSSRPTFHTTNKIGLQFYQKIGENFSATTQFLAQGQDSDFDFNANWAFLTWNAKPDLTVRAGRVVIPLFLLSEYLDVGYAYPWVRPPLEMYAGSPLNKWSGIDFSKSGYKGSWDYRVTVGGGTVNELVYVGTDVVQEFVTRNGLTFNSEFGTDVFRFRFGVSRVDIEAEPGLSTVDGIVNATTSLYSAWAVNDFNNAGNIKDFNELNQTNAIKLLGDFISPTLAQIAVVATGLDLGVKSELFNTSNQEFIAATLAAGLAGNVSQGIYGEILPPANIANQLERVGDALTTPLAIDNLTTFGGILVGMSPEAEAIRDAYAGSVGENTANAMLGVLTAYGATENASLFNGLTQLNNLKGDSVDANYGLLIEGIKGVVNQTYGLELKNHLYKTFNNTWRSASFLGAGFTYDDFNWYAIGEYGYRRTPGYFGDSQGYYLTLGKRFGSFLPHLTYAVARIKDAHVRLVTPGIYAGQNDPNELLSGNAANDWKNLFENVRDGVSDSALASTADYENLLFITNQLADLWDNSQSASQDSISAGIRYDWRSGICLKAEVQHVRPKLGFRGHFDPWDRKKKDTGNVFMMTLDAVF